MGRDTQRALYGAWPQIFRQKDLDPTSTSMCWGIQCDEGWAGLVDALCEVTAAHARAGAHPVLAATGVKQKLGTLRVHFDARCGYCDGAGRMVEAFSARLCEVSGRPGVLCGGHGGGVKTLAPDIADQLGLKVERTDQAQRSVNPEVPAGWQGIVDALVGLAGNLSPGSAIDIGMAQDRLRVGLSNASDYSLLGATACAAAISRRTNPATGQVVFTGD
jgi:hypothetical protein